MTIQQKRRSFVRRELERAAPTQPAVAGRLAIADASPFPRCGFKGPGTVGWLNAQGIEARAEPNRAFALADGSMVAMLSWSEALILDGWGGEGPSARLSAAWSLEADTRCYEVPRRDSHYWFFVCGSAAPQLFAKLCGVDLSPAQFPLWGVVQTILARSCAIIIRDRQADGLAYHLLGDSASAVYIWQTLAEAMKVFEGGVIGPDALRGLRR